MNWKQGLRWLGVIVSVILVTLFFGHRVYFAGAVLIPIALELIRLAFKNSGLRWPYRLVIVGVIVSLWGLSISPWLDRYMTTHWPIMWNGSKRLAVRADLHFGQRTYEPALQEQVVFLKTAQELDANNGTNLSGSLKGVIDRSKRGPLSIDDRRFLLRMQQLVLQNKHVGELLAFKNPDPLSQLKELRVQKASALVSLYSLQSDEQFNHLLNGTTEPKVEELKKVFQPLIVAESLFKAVSTTVPTEPRVTVRPTPAGQLDTATKVISVSSDAADGVPVGLTVRAGQLVTFDVSGTVDIGRGEVGPAGETDGYFDRSVDSPYFQNVGGLEGWVGQKAYRFFVGSGGTVRMPSDGEVTLRVIESIHGYTDGNRGAFEARAKIAS